MAEPEKPKGVLTEVAYFDEDGKPDLYDKAILCGAHFLPKWKSGKVEITRTDIPEDEEDCEDCHFTKYLGMFLNE